MSSDLADLQILNFHWRMNCTKMLASKADFNEIQHVLGRNRYEQKHLE